jgi:hypothetical protein
MPEASIDQAERVRRRNEADYARRKAMRQTNADLRTRAARRQREVERKLRDELVRQGRVISILDEMEIGSLAAVIVQIDYMRAQQTRGANVDLEQLTRLLNTQGRLISALGLRPQVAEPPPNLSDYLAAKQERPA